jgi:taurine dioxygenase
MADQQPLEIEPIGGHLGAAVRGLDAESIDESTAKALKQGLTEHGVLFLQGLSPSLEGLRDIGALFGPLEVHPYLPKADENVPEVCSLDSAEGGVAADLWHTDVTFSESPPIAALLHMIECPTHGGDTMWLSTQAVFDSLSLPMQEFLTGLTCIHESRQGPLKAEHPVVRGEPQNRRPAR